MADDAEIAAGYAAQFNRYHIARLQAKKAAAPVASAEFCAMCDEPIPAGRRAAQPGCQFCIICQQQVDRGEYGR